MDVWQSITVRSIDNVFIVPSEKGKDAPVRRSQYGLSFSYGGRISYYLDGTRYVSDHDHAILLPCRDYFLRREITGDFPVINFTCTEEFCFEKFRVVALRNPDSYLKDFERMRALWLTGKNPAKLMSVFYDVLGRLAEEERNHNNGHILTPAMDYLATHFSDPALSNQLLAKQANVSEVYFRKLFKEIYGVSPKQYILNMRINHAKILLSEQAATVTSIAESCGFSSVYHFCRAFKDISGHTPTEYAKYHRA